MLNSPASKALPCRDPSYTCEPALWEGLEAWAGSVIMRQEGKLVLNSLADRKLYLIRKQNSVCSVCQVVQLYPLLYFRGPLAVAMPSRNRGQGAKRWHQCRGLVMG